MVPNTILNQLNRLRWRERLLRLVYGLTLGFTIAVGVLAVFCLADWLIDRFQDTPLATRQAMLGVQIALWLLLAAVLLLWALMKSLSDDALALYVEDKAPEFGHRLISALQLNRPNANTLGMSPALIAAATAQAEEMAAKRSFASLADHSRMERVCQMLFGIILVAAPLLIFAFDLVAVLVARQFLADRDIPRSVSIAAVANHQVAPAGEEVELQFLVRGPGLGSDTEGEVKIEPKGAPAETYPLVFAHRNSNGDAVYTTKVRPGTVSYDYRAWLRDGRTRQAAHMQIEPRPAVVKLDAWVQLPEYTGRRPNGQPYETHQARGDVAGLLGTKARIAIETQKPIERATVELLGRPAPELLAGMPMPEVAAPLGGFLAWLVPVMVLASDDVAGPGALPGASPLPEFVYRRIAMKIGEDKQHAEAVFDLRPGEQVYRVEVADQYGFRNLDLPRRNIRLDPEEPPVVALLPERFHEAGKISSEDDEFEGVPVLHRGKFRFAYTTSTPLGLGKALLRYRINGEGEWWPLPLREVKATPKTGPFDLKHGSFIHSGFLDKVEFHQIPSPDVERFPPGIDGGGRYDFETAGLNLKVGDKIEFYVEVFDRNPNERQPGRSEVRQKTIVDLDQYLAWKEGIAQEESRIRQLENTQRSVFSTAMAGGEERPYTGLKPPTEVKTPVKPAPTTYHSFVRDWLVVGPFANDNNGAGFETVYPPEEKVELGKAFDGIKGKVRWKAHHGNGDFIDFEKIFKHDDAGVAYAVCWVRAENDVKANLLTGSDDGIKVWLDRKLVQSKKARRDALAGEDKAVVSLKEDEWQELCVKVDSRTGSWGFFLEFVHPTTGRPIEGLKVRTSPPGSDDRRFVRDWQVIGPFPNVGDDGRNTAYPPEKDPVALDKEYDGVAGKVKWKEHKSEGGRIGFDKIFERPFNESNQAYAVCWVKAPEGMEKAVLATGSDDGIKVWVNRKVVVDAAVSRDAEPGKDLQPITLEKGWNEVLVKVDNRFGRWAFYLELRDPDTEQPLEGLEVRTTPPEEK